MPRSNPKPSRRLSPRYRTEREGQFLERKSCFDRRGQTGRPLPWKKMAADISETLVAFANADGGELIVGLDDDGTPSEVPGTENQIARLAEVPGTRVTPPLPVVPVRFEIGGRLRRSSVRP